MSLSLSLSLFMYIHIYIYTHVTRVEKRKQLFVRVRNRAWILESELGLKKGSGEEH